MKKIDLITSIVAGCSGFLSILGAWLLGYVPISYGYGATITDLQFSFKHFLGYWFIFLILGSILTLLVRITLSQGLLWNKKED